MLIKHPHRWWAVFGASLLVGLYVVWPNPLYDGLERITYDRLVRWGPVLEQDARVVIVDVDERSLQAVGPWPWPRKTMANLIDRLIHQHQVAVLGIDVIFANPRENDATLKQALTHPAVILSQTFEFGAPADKISRVGRLVDTFSAPNVAPQARGFVANHDAVLSSNPMAGHISPVIDDDGKVRRLHPVICYEDQCSLALSLRMWQALWQETSAPQWQQATWQGSAAWSWPLVPEARIPVDQQGRMWVPYRVSPGGFQYVSAVDVIQGRVTEEQLAQRIVLLGSTAVGLADRVATPLEAIAPGVEVHAQVLSAALDHQLLEPWAWSSFAAILAVAVLLVSLWYWPGSGPGRVLWWVVLAESILMATHAGLFWQGHAWFALTPGFLWILCVGVMWLLLDSAVVHAQIVQVTRQFSHFLPQVLVKRLLQGADVQASSERQLLTVLVADMRGFTQACEGQSPEAAALLAQQCLATLSAVVAQHQGTVEKYTGDGLMAIWGAPLPDSEHARHAVEAAQAMLVAVANLQPWLLAHGFEPMEVSIGINTGEMAVGIFGDDAHLAWTAQGDAVNLATRIEQLTRTLGYSVLLGKARLPCGVRSAALIWVLTPSKAALRPYPSLRFNLGSDDGCFQLSTLLYENVISITKLGFSPSTMKVRKSFFDEGWVLHETFAEMLVGYGVSLRLVVGRDGLRLASGGSDFHGGSGQGPRNRRGGGAWHGR